MSNRTDKEKGVNVQVLLRCRPFSEEELRSNAPQVLTCNEHQREVAVLQNFGGKHIDRVFTFDKVFGPSAQQKDLYKQAIVPIVNEVLEGFNCTIFAYGQTGTGKTYTMEGDCKRSKSGPNGQLPAEAGVIPRAIKQIFDTLESQNAEYSVKVTFLELYNEEITDLLAPEEVSKVALEDRQKKQLPLMEDGKGGVLVRGLEEEIVTSANEIFTLLERGSAKRRTAETLLNKQSSRSHSLFSITIHIKEATPEGEELIKCGKLNLVDLAGSENISRSGAREGRAREAGEINKSLLTLGRVINALVEHLGHVPYRDSKLTRLLRDSLGGRTKTCIIATVSPAVHCLEETLSTLDYAHRAKNIRNKPEVNQKMMKTTLIKELYGEIERLKAELHAAREKNGVYIPKERYHQEENERKAMTDQIELMGVTIENQQKQLEDLRSRYDAEVQQCSDLSNKLDSTEKKLNFIRKLLTGSEEEVKKCKYALKEKEFIISEQKKAEDALSQQACSMRSELEKALQNNASLYSKIAREDKLSADNKSIVISYQENLAEKVGFLCNTVASSISQQKDRLKCVDSLCHSLLNRHNEAMTDLMKKVMESRTAYVSHIESLQNIVRSHNAESDARLDEITVLASSEARSIEEFLITEAAEATSIHNDLQATLSRHLGEMAVFARELQQRFNDGVEHMKEISLYIGGYLQKIVEELSKLSNHATKEIQEKNISAFQKSFEEMSKSNAEKLIADMTSLLMGLVNNHLRCQQEMVNARLNDLRENDKADKAFLDDHVSTMEGITTDAKRKWQAFSVQASNDANDTINLSAMKHCRMEQLVEESMSVAETASKQWKRTHESVNEMSSKQALALGSIVRSVVERHKQHIDEVDTTRYAAEQETVRSTEEIAKQLDCWSESQQKVVDGILSSTKAQEDDLEVFRKDHSGQATLIEKETRETFQERYMEYEQTGLTPEKCEPDIPSAGTLQSLRVMPMDELVAEFRETHPYETTNEKHTKPSFIPRSPFAEVN
ncbi:hypothetical protein Droror1_Dr00013806 [Drosera rotundifolia]